MIKWRSLSNYSENHLKSDQYRDATRLRALELISWILDSGDHTRLGLTREDVVTPLRKVFKPDGALKQSDACIQYPKRDQSLKTYLRRKTANPTYEDEDEAQGYTDEKKPVHRPA